MDVHPSIEREERDDPGEVVTADRLALLQATVDHHARHIARVAPESGGDLQDLRQALFLEAWTAVPKFRPERGTWPAFINVYVKGAAWDLAGRRFRQRRLAAHSLESRQSADPREPQPWQAQQADIDSSPDDRFERIEQVIDLERAVDTLPEGLRQLCRLLQRDSPTAAQRKSGLSPAEFYRRRDEIAMRFRAFGISQR